MIDWRGEEDRWVDRRSQYLKRAAGLDDTNAELIAYSELGYSTAGIAKQVDIGESTVKARFDEIEETYGKPALFARRSDNLAIKAPLGGDD
jgi:hypothetical protein